MSATNTTQNKTSGEVKELEDELLRDIRQSQVDEDARGELEEAILRILDEYDAKKEADKKRVAAEETQKGGLRRLRTRRSKQMRFKVTRKRKHRKNKK